MTQTSALQNLIRLFAKVPGLGARSARRVVLHLLKHRDDLMGPLQEALTEVSETIQECTLCGNWDVQNPCSICQDPRRDPTTLCVTADVADLWALERTSSYHGSFHTLGGTLSALHGVTPEHLRINSLIKRIQEQNVHEVILALDATVDGQTTVHYLVTRLKPLNVQITALAHGVPVGGELDYLDEGTISTALKARRAL